MNKFVFIFGTKLRMYLCELPIVLLLICSIHFNDSMTNAFKLYPLIIACIAGIIFMFIYLFRGIIISREIVRSFGPFSSRDKVIVNKDKTLVLTLRPKHKIKVELFGDDDAPDLDWVDKADSSSRKNVNLYRDIAVGGEGTVKRILAYFDLNDREINEIVTSENGSLELADIAISKKKSELGDVYSITFLKTL